MIRTVYDSSQSKQEFEENRGKPTVSNYTVYQDDGTGSVRARRIDLDRHVAQPRIRYAQCVCVGFTTSVTTGDGKFYFVVPPQLAGYDLVSVHAKVVTAGTTSTTDIQLHNLTDAVDMLSTKITIDSTETGSDTAATAAVIDTSKDDVTSYDIIRIDVDAVSTTAPKGLIVTMGFRFPQSRVI